MAASLPSDLLQCVLETWLDANVNIVAKMDVAICNHSLRADFLAVIAQITFPNKCHCLFYQTRHLSNYMQWIVSRKVKVTELWLHVLDIEKAAGEVGFISLPTIRKIHFGKGFEAYDERFNINFGLLAVFLSKFPSLTAFRGWWTMTDDHLAMVRSLGYKLEDLDIMACPFISSSAEAEMIASVAASLVSLQFTPTDETLTALNGVAFPALKSIHIDCWHIEEPENISRFCSAASGTLESLRIYSDEQNHPDGNWDFTDNCLTHEVAESIAKVCKQLTSFAFFCKLAEECMSLRAVLANAPQIREMNIGNCSSFVFLEGSGWDIRAECTCTNFISEIIAGIRGPIARITTTDDGTFTDASLRLMATKFGAHIIHFQSRFEDDVNDDTLAYVLPLLSNLESFHFSMYGVEEDITDASLTLLHVCCPKITDLEICGHVTDDGMCAILDGYKGNKMTSLKLAGCKLLTDITLNKVADTFPDMERLDMSYTSINKETVVRLIVAKKLRVKEVGCPEDEWVRAALTKVGHEGTEVGPRCTIC